jgi:GNAT superfamily N-acetyltransferase
MEPKLRLLEPPPNASDLDVLANFVSEYYAFDRLTFDERLARQAMVDLISDARLGRIWLLELEQEPIGYLVLTFGFLLEFHGRHAVIDEVYLRANFRNRGYFRIALSFVEATCRELGVRFLRLEVESKNIAAQEKYRKAGFRQHDRLLMTKRLV